MFSRISASIIFLLSIFLFLGCEQNSLQSHSTATLDSPGMANTDPVEPHPLDDPEDGGNIGVDEFEVTYDPTDKFGMTIDNWTVEEDNTDDYNNLIVNSDYSWVNHNFEIEYIGSTHWPALFTYDWKLYTNLHTGDDSTAVTTTGDDIALTSYNYHSNEPLRYQIVVDVYYNGVLESTFGADVSIPDPN